MANLLLTVWPIDTHLTPFVALAYELRDRGHQVAFYTGPQSGLELQQQGFRWFNFQKLDSGLAERNPGAQSNLKLSVQQTRRMWNDFLLASLPGQIEDLQKICAEWHPDAIVCDMTLWGPILVVEESLKIPVAVLSHTAYCVLPGKENAAPGISLPPPRTAFGRMALKMVARFLNKAGGINRDADRMRATHSLPSLDVSVTEFTGQVPLYLVPSTPEFDYNRGDLASTVHYVGLCVPPETAKQSAPAWAHKTGVTPRIVVLEEPHYPEDPWLLRTAADAFGGAPAELILVAGHGRNLASLNLGRLAPNVRVEGWVPIETAIASADVLVVHGNSETVLAALAHGIPVLILPRILEQPQIAWRLAASGAGLRLPMKGVTPEKMRQAAEQVLRTPSFKQNAQRLGKALTSRGGPTRAAELIEQMVATR